MQSQTLTPSSIGTPGYENTYFQRGLSRIHLGEHWDAIEDFKLAVQISSTSAYEIQQEARRPDYGYVYDGDFPTNVCYFLGVAYLNLEEYSAAISHLSRAIRRSLDFSDGHYQLGLAKFRLGEYHSAFSKNYGMDARKADEEVMQLSPDSPNYADAEARFRMANDEASWYSRSAEDNFQCAGEEFTRAIELRPEHVDAHYHRGLLKLNRDFEDDSLPSYREYDGGAIADFQRDHSSRPES